MEKAVDWQAWFTLLVIGGILVSLVRNRIRPEFVFLSALGILLIAGIVTPAQAFSGFANEAVITVGALFVVAAGVQNTRALGFVERILLPGKIRESAVMFRMMGSTAFMSALLNNTPIVAMLTPQVQKWAERTGRPVSKYLIPLSYAAIIGGTITLIGTSTNLIVSGMLVQRGYEPLAFFELTWIGLPAALIVLIYFIVIGHRSLPEYKITSKDDDTDRSYQFDLEVPADSELINRTVEEAGLRALGNAFLIHKHRDGRYIGPIGPDTVLQAGDLLTFIGEMKHVDELTAGKGLRHPVPVLDDKPEGDISLFEAVVSESSPLVGRTLKESEFRDRYHGVVVGIQRHDEYLRGALGNIPIKSGDLLLIEAKPGFDKRWNGTKEDFYLVAEKGHRNLPVSEKAPLVMLILVLMIGIAAVGLAPIVITAFIAAVLIVLTGCVHPRQFISALNPSILLIIAGAIGVGQAMDTSGLAVAGSSVMLDMTSAFGFIAVIAAIYITTNVLTECITNNAAAVLMVPLAIAAAYEIGIDPHAVSVTVAMAASASFLTPFGYHTNLMVMGAGGYKFTDYVKAGIPVTLIVMTVTVIMVSLLWL
jgi:di/tricarboxylate transporter